MICKQANPRDVKIAYVQPWAHCDTWYTTRIRSKNNVQKQSFHGLPTAIQSYSALLHWSYSHQPDFLDEDTEQCTGAQMHCEDAIAKWCWYYCNTSSWLSQYNAFFWLRKNIESATRDLLCPMFDLCTELWTLAASSCLCGSQYILQRTSSCRRDNAKQNVSNNLNLRQYRCWCRWIVDT